MSLNAVVHVDASFVYDVFRLVVFLFSVFEPMLVLAFLELALEVAVNGIIAEYYSYYCFIALREMFVNLNQRRSHLFNVFECLVFHILYCIVLLFTVKVITVSLRLSVDILIEKFIVLLSSLLVSLFLGPFFYSLIRLSFIITCLA